MYMISYNKAQDYHISSIIIVEVINSLIIKYQKWQNILEDMLKNIKLCIVNQFFIIKINTNNSYIKLLIKIS